MVQDTYKRVQFYGKVADGGNDSRVSVANHASLNMVDAFTVMARVYLNPDDKIIQQTDNGIVCKSNGTGPGGGFVLEYSGTAGTRTFVFSILSGGVGYTASLNGSVTEKGWYHVVGTFDSALPNTNIKLFQNAVRVATQNRAAVMDVNALNVLVGGITTANWMFKGYISEAQIYNRALTEDEINYAYLHPNNPKRRGLVLSLVQTSIDKPAAGTWKDVSPQTGNNGTITNATTSKYPSISAGRNALFFPVNSPAERVTVTDAASIRLNDEMTIEVWYLPNRLNVGAGLSTKWIANTGWEFNVNSNKSLSLYCDNAYAIQSVVNCVTVGAWNHLVVTFKAGFNTGKSYVNGIDKTSTTLAPNMTANNTDLKLCNSSTSTVPTTGFVCASRMYNRVLTPAEVAYNYRHPNNPKRRGLVLNLSQESLYGTKWYDLSGNANNGTITGAIAKNIADSLTGD